MKCSHHICCFLLSIILTGCETVRTSSSQDDIEETTQALTTIAGAITGDPMTDQQMEELAKELKTDPQARTAVENITESLAGQRQVKYCPVTGKRYAPNLQKCSEHNVELILVE